MKVSIWFTSSIAALLLCGYLALASLAKLELPSDNLISTPWWQFTVHRQITITQAKQYNACLFGDSISSGLGNTLGERNFNYAIGGMSTISLVEQLKLLSSSNVQCQTAIIAIGTNDAWYHISNDLFIKNLKKSILLLQEMGSVNIVVLPAFYSTVAASHNSHLAGTIKRVEEINVLIRQVAKEENILIKPEIIQDLFKDQALKENLTTDGVHLNAQGKNIYKEALLNLLSSTSAQHATTGN